MDAHGQVFQQLYHSTKSRDPSLLGQIRFLIPNNYLVSGGYLLPETEIYSRANIAICFPTGLMKSQLSLSKM